MTDQQQPIDLPSYRLVQELMHESGFDIAHPDKEALLPASKYMKLASRLIRHGADQELEACCKWIPELTPWDAEKLRAARRPKPPSLKKQAYAALDTYIYGNPDPGDKQSTYNTIRRALEQLND